MEDEGRHRLLHHTAVPEGGQLAFDEGLDELHVTGFTEVCSKLDHELRGQLLVEDQFGVDGEDPQFLELVIVEGRRLAEGSSHVLGIEGRRRLLGRYDLWFGLLDGVIQEPESVCFDLLVALELPVALYAREWVEPEQPRLGEVDGVDFLFEGLRISLNYLLGATSRLQVCNGSALALLEGAGDLSILLLRELELLHFWCGELVKILGFTIRCWGGEEPRRV